jgi:hypothetical protein
MTAHVVTASFRDLAGPVDIYACDRACPAPLGDESFVADVHIGAFGEVYHLAMADD